MAPPGPRVVTRCTTFTSSDQIQPYTSIGNGKLSTIGGGTHGVSTYNNLIMMNSFHQEVAGNLPKGHEEKRRIKRPEEKRRFKSHWSK